MVTTSEWTNGRTNGRTGQCDSLKTQCLGRLCRVAKA